MNVDNTESSDEIIPPISSPLQEACSNGNVNEVKRLLAKKKSASERFESLDELNLQDNHLHLEEDEQNMEQRLLAELTEIDIEVRLMEMVEPL